MKQTNNAIKFLMAQYRAIFRNANLKMFLAAATAAAAMAAGQAQAAAASADAEKWSEIPAAPETTYDGTNQKITITATDTDAENQTAADGFDIILTGGTGTDNFIKGKQNKNTLGPAASADPETSITLNASTGKAAGAILTIGSDQQNEHVDVTISSFKNLAGTLNIEGNGAESKLNASTIALGNGKDADSNAVIVLKGKGVLGDKTSTTQFDILSGGKLQFSGAGAKAAASGAISLQGGNITVDATATDAIVEGGLDVSGGSIEVAAAGALTVSKKLELKSGSVKVAGGANSGSVTVKDLVSLSSETSAITVSNGAASGGVFTAEKGLTMTNGKITVDGGDDTDKAAKLSIIGDTEVSSGSVSAGQNSKLTLNGNASFAKGTLKLDTTSKVDFATFTGSGTRTLTVNSTDIKTVLDTANAITGTGAADDTLVLKLNDTDAVNLLDSKLVADGGTKSTGFNLTGAYLTIKGDKASYKKGKFNDTTAYDFNTLEVGEAKAFELAEGAKVKVHKSISDADGAELKTLTVTKGTLTLDSLSDTGTGKVVSEAVVLSATGNADTALLKVDKGVWDVKALTLTKGQATVNGRLNVAGALTIAAGSTVTVDGGFIDTTVGSGSLALAAADANALTLKKGGYLKVDGNDILKENALDTSKVKGEAIKGGGSEIIEIDNKAALTQAQFESLRDKALTNFTGIIKFSKPVDIKLPEGKLTLQNIVHGTDSSVYNESTLHVKDTESISKTYSVGNVLISGPKNLELAEGGNLFLNKANAATGGFVSKTDADGKTEVSGFDFKGTNNSITLTDTGKIGSITTATTGSGSVLIGKLNADNTSTPGHVTVVKGNSIGATDMKLDSVILNDGSSLTVESGDVFTNNLTVHDANVSVTGAIETESAQINGSGIISADTLMLNDAAVQDGDAHRIAGGATIDVKKLVLGTNNALLVGEYGEDETTPGSSAQIFADVLQMNADSSLFIDPAFGKKAALVVAEDINDTGAKDPNGAAVLKGGIYVGRNSALGIGFTEDEFNEVMSGYLTYNDGFDPDADADAMKNALVLNKPLKVENGKKVVLDESMTADNYQKKGANNELTIDSGSALILTDKAFGAGKTDAAIQFTAAGGKINVVDATNGAKVILLGDFDEKDTALKLATTAGNDASLEGGKLVLEAANGLLKGEIVAGASSTFKLAIDETKKHLAYDGVSTPVGDLIINKFKGNLAKDSTGYLFIAGLVSSNDFKAFDASAHAATYAGAQQAAVAAVGSMAEAVGGRVGSMGVEAATISATGSQANGGVWLSPMYKSVDADGFNAQGASYGADIDLAGVAFGTDTVNGNMRFGAVFNIGSGDADGKGNGNGLKDEFDYYGFGMYSVMGFGNFALVGDASLNVISHEVKGLDAKASADTTAVTMGVTGQYTISNPAVDVTPHVGARFIRLDTDSYDLVADGKTVATTDFDVQNVFSIPLGVTLSKAFEMGGWSLAPSADLSITFNTGDTEVKSVTKYSNISTGGMTTEVLDEVTYGVAVGLGAQYGAFGTNIGLNYTGSSNTDSFGVNAQARYMF